MEDVTKIVETIVAPVIPVAKVPETQPEKTGEKTFTQEQLEEVLKERIKRAEDTAAKRILEALGVSDVDTAKNALKAHSEAEEAKKSEVEKLQSKITAAEQRAVDAEAKLSALIAERKTEKRNQSLNEALTEAKASNAKRLLTLMTTEQVSMMADLFDENDAPVKGKVDALLEMAKKTYPEYFTVQTAPPGSPSNRKGSVPEPDKGAKDTASAVYRRMMRNYF